MVKRTQHIGTFLHSEMGISLGGMSPMCTCASIHLQKIFFLRSIAFTCEHQERGYQAYALRLLGDIAAQREPKIVELAEAHYRQALALAEELGMRPL